jgi:hypothetical protein
MSPSFILEHADDGITPNVRGHLSLSRKIIYDNTLDFLRCRLVTVADT